jgi:hypothetical protein
MGLQVQIIRWNGNGLPFVSCNKEHFLVNFEKDAVQQTDLKSKLWLRYVDDIFIQWSHGESNLKTFLKHLNELIKLTIKCTIEREVTLTHPFFDVQGP